MVDSQIGAHGPPYLVQWYPIFPFKIMLVDNNKRRLHRVRRSFDRMGNVPVLGQLQHGGIAEGVGVAWRIRGCEGPQFIHVHAIILLLSGCPIF